MIIKMKIAIILVNYNGEKYNNACIDSILKNKDEHEKYILVVDNASTDNSVINLKEQYPWLELILLDDNHGFAVGNNKGIERAKELGADYVLLLNNDTEIASDMIGNILACAGRYPGSVIAPKIYYSDDRERIWSAGGSISSIVEKVSHDGLNQIDTGQFDVEKKIEFATGCCLLLPMSVIERVGMLDERFFLYYEDAEYSFRLRKLGISIYYCPQAVLYHKVGASSKGEQSPLCAYYISRNWLLCNKQYLGKKYPLFLVYYIMNRSACCWFWLLRRKPQLVYALLRGMRDFQKGKFGKSEYYR